MGGCRCTYRNCSMRSNKLEQVHFFHFPVFDKPRCHQWITNAQKLNFLNLKVSQLKNRVICEHHFKDSEFMNYTKGKLKHDAVPTEDGPYCNKQTQEQEENMLPINLEDIEYNEQLSVEEKRAHFPVKYGDFLMNEVSEPIVYPTSKSSSKLQQDALFDTYYHKLSSNNHYDNLTLKTSPAREIPQDIPDGKVKKKEIKQIKKVTRTPRNTYNKVKIISEKKISEPVTLQGELHTVSPSLVLTVPDKKTRQMELNNPQVEAHYVNIEIPQTTTDVPIFSNKELEFQPAITEQSTYNEYPNSSQIFNIEEYNLNTQNVDMSQNIKPNNLYVLQEMNPGVNQMVDQVSTDTPLLTSESGVLAPISGVSIDMPDISMPTTKQVFTHTVKKDKPMFTNCTVAENPNISMIGAKIQDSKQEDVKVTVFKDTRSVTPTKKQTKTFVSPTVNKTATKTKVPPEKMAEIVEKRKYNMKLRDIITSCIDKLDEESEPTKLSENKNKKMTERKVGDHLSSDPSSQENIMAYLETRLQRMEDALLNKIDQNTQRIAELKKTYKPPKIKKSTFTQTYANLDTKKQLYQQISKFLTPEANSLIYEELFINKFSEKLLNNEPPKKRKRR